MRPAHRIITGGLLVTLTVTGLILFHLHKQRTPERPVIYIATPSPRLEILPVYLGIASGHFDEAGLRVCVLNTGAGGRQKPGMLIACNMEDVLYSHIFHGEDHVVVSTLTKHEYALLLSREPEPFAWEKTKGKSIITAVPTSSTTAILEAVLRENGVYPHREAVLIQNLPEKLRIPLFIAGTGDYIVAPEPAATVLTRSRKAFLAAPLSKGKPLYLIVLAAPENWAGKNRAVLTAFTRALAPAQAELYDRPAAEIAWTLGAYFPQVSLCTLEAAIARGQREKVWDSGRKPNPAHFHRLQEILKRSGELPCAISYEEVFWGQ